MSPVNDRTFMLLGSYLYSLIPFRGDLLECFRRQGFSLVASAAEVDDEIAMKLAEKSVVYEQVAMRRDSTNVVKDFILLLKYIGLVRRKKPSVVLAYTIKPVIYGCIAAALVRVPVRVALITGMGSMFSAGASRTKQRLVGCLYKFSLYFCHLVIFQNEDDLAYFVQRGWVSLGKCIRVMGSGVRLSDYAVDDFPPQVTFTMVSRLLKEKGVQEYLEAAEAIVTKYPGVKFKLIGWVDDEVKCVSLDVIKSFEKKGAVEYMGRSDDIKAILAGTSVFVLPTYYREGVPRTLLEAMAAGRPIITTNTPGCADTVVHGWNGFVVQPKNVSDLVCAMEHFVLNRDDIRSMGENSKSIAMEKFDVDKVNSMIVSAVMQRMK